SESMPHLVEDRGYVAGTASRALAKNVRQPTERPRAASVRMIPRLQDEKCAERAERHSAAALAALEYRRERRFQRKPAGLVEQNEIDPFRVIGAADQRNVALARLNARGGDPHRIDAGRFFAHERAR